MKTPEDNISYWRDVMVNPNHPHRKKFSKEYKPHEIEDYIQKMIATNEKDLELKTKAA